MIKLSELLNESFESELATLKRQFNIKSVRKGKNGRFGEHLKVYIKPNRPAIDGKVYSKREDYDNFIDAVYKTKFIDFEGIEYFTGNKSHMMMAIISKK